MDLLSPPPPPLRPPPLPPPVKHSSRQPIQSTRKPILPEPRRTNPIVWCIAIFCCFFSLLMILSGIATLIVFLAVQPRNPAFDTPAATLLSVVYLVDPLQFLLNSDLLILANISNPNKNLDIAFDYLDFELSFRERPIASRVVQPFRERPGEVRLIRIDMVSSLVYLPAEIALELQKQEQRNRISYEIKGKFRVRIEFGLIRYSYWLYAECSVEVTGPPTGVLTTRSCRTKR